MALLPVVRSQEAKVMRPIKFRQRVNGRFHYWGWLQEAVAIFTGPVNPHDRSDQFTGLHDKSGTEIYEEDVVKAETFHDGKVINSTQGVIAWDDKRACFNVRDRDVLRGLHIPSWTFEVIGNVFENPELVSK